MNKVIFQVYSIQEKAGTLRNMGEWRLRQGTPGIFENLMELLKIIMTSTWCKTSYWHTCL